MCIFKMIDRLVKHRLYKNMDELNEIVGYKLGKFQFLREMFLPYERIFIFKMGRDTVRLAHL